MRVPSPPQAAFWIFLLAFSICSMGLGQTAGPVEAVSAPDDPGELANLLVEHARARFALRCKAFGVPELVEAIDLAYDLRAAAARLDEDKEAELAAVRKLHSELEHLAAAVEKSCSGVAAPIVDRELVRYRTQQAAAQAAEHAGDRAAAIEHQEKAIKAAGGLQRALTTAREAGVLPVTEMLQLSWHETEAKIALINLTSSEATEASKARSAALEELAHVADESLETIRGFYGLGLTSLNDVVVVDLERSRIAARLARERGDQEGELSAARKLLGLQTERLRRLRHFAQQNIADNRDFEQATFDLSCATALLRELQARQEVDHSAGSPRQQAMIDRQLCSSAKNKAMAEFERAEGDFERFRVAHQEGLCGAAVVIEAAARRCLREMVLRQCQLDLERLQR